MTDAVRSRAAVRQAATASPSATRARLAHLAHTVVRPITGLDAFERLFYSGLLLMAGGLVFIAPPLALLVPGIAISSVALILKLRRP